MKERFLNQCTLWYLALRRNAMLAAAKLKEVKGQGTTEYAILVGVLVVVAIGAIALLKPKVEDLWDAIVAALSVL